MRSNRLAALAVLLVASTASAGGGAIFVPPAEVSVGVGAPLGATAQYQSSTEVLAGIHWASLYWHPTRFDIGLGYVGSFRQLGASSALRESGMPDSDANRLALDGGYISLAYAIESHPHWRTWLGARVESMEASLAGTSFAVLGEAVRLDGEVFTTGAAAAGGHGGGALVAGAFSVGFYVEAVHRDLPPELGPNALTAGVSMRIPFILVAAN